jgi:hypothetical protein
LTDVRVTDLRGHCCVEANGTADVCGSRSDRSGELGARDRDAPVRVGFDAELVMASPEVLHERVTTHDHAGGVVTCESAHRPQPSLEPGMVSLIRLSAYCTVLWNAAGDLAEVSSPGQHVRNRNVHDYERSRFQRYANDRHRKLHFGGQPDQGWNVGRNEHGSRLRQLAALRSQRRSRPVRASARPGLLRARNCLIGACGTRRTGRAVARPVPPVLLAC